MSNSEPLATAAIIGAGPYGISLAAHLNSTGVDFRIFGRPMTRWIWNMPRGMFLKSEGFASNLSDPRRRFTLASYCERKGLPYRDSALPVPLEIFTRYALDFQRQLAPELENIGVERVEREGSHFRLTLAGGNRLRASNVVVACGLEHASYVPHELACLPAALLTHASAHHDLSRFRGKTVTVIGGGQSALETAALLSEQGADVRLLVRSPSVAWNPPARPDKPSLQRRLRAPSSGLGAGFQLWTYANAPHLFRFLPARLRFNRMQRVLGPAGAAWLKERVLSGVAVLPGHTVQTAEARGGCAALHVRRSDGASAWLYADHVIAATGYRFVVDRLPFLSDELKRGVQSELGYPSLSPYFESTVPGLYFTGLASAPTFGPAMRFLEGAGYTARRIAHRLSRVRHGVQTEPELQFEYAKS